jgi:hypothetical protein
VGSGFRVQGLELRACLVRGKAGGDRHLGRGAAGGGFRVQGSGFRIQGLEFRV